MFKVGERRKPTKVLPGLLRVSPVRCEAVGQHEDPHRRFYVVTKLDAHDDQRTDVVPTGKPSRAGGKTMEFDGLPHEFDLPSYGFHGKEVVVELWGTVRDKHPDEDDEVDALLLGTQDVLVGTLRLPVPWLANAYGGGYTVSQDEPALLRMVLEGLEPRTYPYEMELRLEYIPQDEHSQRAQQRWSSLNFEGTFELDRDRSDSTGPLLQQQGVPFFLRKLNEYAGDQRLEIKMLGGGDRASFTTSTAFYRDATGPMRVDGLFMSVKTYRGAVVEKRLYWDWSVVGKIKNGEPYPSGILMVVTRLDAGAKQIIEAWDLSRDRSTLTQLTMLGDSKFRREWVRVPEPVPEPVKHPKVLTRKGTLLVGVMRGWDITPEDDEPVAAFAALKVLQFGNKDTHYANPLRDDAKEETTQVLAGQPNPVWNQVFHFPIATDDDEHNALVVQLWNRENEDEEVLIGTARVPVPWVFNGFGSELGPAGISSYEATFKLKRGDVLDPTAKSTYGGGRVTLRFSYQPDFS